MSYAEWMREDWEVTSCSGTTGLQVTTWLNFVDEADGKKVRFKATGALWGTVSSYALNGDQVQGVRNGVPFVITRAVPLTGKASLSCTISGSGSYLTGGSFALAGGGAPGSSFALMDPSGKKPGPSKRKKVGGGSQGPDPGGGGSWTALEGG